jgi:teichuronic acid biosynthesis glycosyltransferase TuaC
MRVLWTHNFSPDHPNNLVFISGAAAALAARGMDIRLEYLGNLRSIHGLLSARQYVRQLSRQFDIVHAQYGSACAVASASATVPRILTVRGNDWNRHSDSLDFHFVHTRLARAMTRWALSRYDHVIAVSRRMTAELTKFARKITTVPSPIDLSRFQPRDRAAARAELGMGGCQKRWVLFNSQRLDDPIKRLPLAQAAFALADANSRGSLRLRVVNGIPHDRLPLEVAACDVILCTSETEGWPNSVKEALACEVPFVSTDVSDLREIAALEPCCRVCSPDAAELAAALVEVLSRPPSGNLRRHVAGMNLNETCNRLVGVYESALTMAARA